MVIWQWPYFPYYAIVDPGPRYGCLKKGMQPLKLILSKKEFNLKIHAKKNFLYKFWKSFVYLVEKKGSGGSTSSAPRDLNFLLVVLILKWNGISFAASSSQIFLHLGPPSVYAEAVNKG